MISNSLYVGTRFPLVGFINYFHLMLSGFLKESLFHSIQFDGVLRKLFISSKNVKKTLDLIDVSFGLV